MKASAPGRQYKLLLARAHMSVLITVIIPFLFIMLVFISLQSNHIWMMCFATPTTSMYSLHVHVH